MELLVSRAVKLLTVNWPNVVMVAVREEGSMILSVGGLWKGVLEK